MSNLVTLCRFHHRKVHEGQVIVQVIDDGAIRFLQPNGESFNSMSRTSGDWRFGVFLFTQQMLYANGKGYQAGDRYAGGAVSYLDVVSAQTDARQAQLGLQDIQSRQLQASAALMGALGGGWAP